MTYPNPWLSVADWLKENGPKAKNSLQPAIAYRIDMLDIETGKTYSKWRYAHTMEKWSHNNPAAKDYKFLGASDKVTLNWEYPKEDPNRPWADAKEITQDADKVRVRHYNKAYQTYCTMRDTLKVGDFVVCAGGSRRYKWRKVISINLETGSIYGQCSSSPNDKGLAFHSSENAMWSITKVVKG